MSKKISDSDMNNELNPFINNLKELCGLNCRSGYQVELRNGQHRRVYFHEKDNKFTTMFGELTWHANGASCQSDDFDIASLGNADNICAKDELKYNFMVISACVSHDAPEADSSIRVPGQ